MSMRLMYTLTKAREYTRKHSPVNKKDEDMGRNIAITHLFRAVFDMSRKRIQI